MIRKSKQKISHLRKFSRKRNDSLDPISEAEVLGATSKVSDGYPPLEIVHQTDVAPPLVARRIQRAEALVPVVEEIRALLEELLSELFFHKCSFAESGLFIQRSFDGTPRLSKSLTDFMYGDPTLAQLRDDDYHNTTYFNRVTSERLISVINVVAQLPSLPMITSFEY